MPLAGDHDHIAAACPLDGVGDRPVPVADLDHLGGGFVRCLGGGLPCADHDGGPDVSRILGARVVIGDDHQVSEFGRNTAHRLAFAGITVSAGAEHHGQPRPRSSHGFQHGAQCPGLVGVVHDGQEVLAPLDHLEPAGNRGRTQSGRSLFRRYSDGIQHGQGEQGIGHVVAAGKPDPQPVVHSGRIDSTELLQPAPGIAVEDHDVLHVPLCRMAVDADGDSVAGAPRHRLTRLIVNAHHGAVGVHGRGRVKKTCLRLEIGFHRRMEVKVVTGQIGETAYGETDSIHPAEFECMAGHFHHGGIDAALRHHRE